MDENKNKDIKLHKSKLITDWNGMIFHPDVVETIDIDYMVRISMYVSIHSRFSDWDITSDSPYVKVVEIREGKDPNDDLLLGQVQSIYRKELDDKYPVRTGDRITFKRENIIEIPISFQEERHKKPLEKFLNKEKLFVDITGPLYTIHSDVETEDEYDSDGSGSYSSESEYTSEEEDEEELPKKKKPFKKV
jgi:hypothetical protein